MKKSSLMPKRKSLTAVVNEHQRLLTNFQLPDGEGRTFDLYRYQAGRAVLLVVYRGEWCGWCRAQLAELNDQVSWFRDRGVCVVALSPDTELYTSILQELLHVSFPLLADPRWQVLPRLGLPRPIQATDIRPAIFIATAAHQIVYQHIGATADDRPPMTDIKRYITERVAPIY